METSKLDSSLPKGNPSAVLWSIPVEIWKKFEIKLDDRVINPDRKLPESEPEFVMYKPEIN